MKFPRTLLSSALLEGLLDTYPLCELNGIGTPESYDQDNVVLVFNQSQLKFLTSQPVLLILDKKIDHQETPFSFITVSNARFLLKQLLERTEHLFFADHDAIAHIHSTAIVHPSVVLGLNVTVGPYSIIDQDTIIGDCVCIGANVHIQKNCVLANGVEIDSHTVLYPKSFIGEKTKIYASSVIGMQGFGFELVNGEWQRLSHLSGVYIGKNCFIGSHVSIAAGTLYPTRIGDNVIIDNHVQIAHHVEIGQGTAIAGCVGIAGSTKIGKYCLIGGGSGIAGHLTISDKVVITGMTMVIKSLTEPGTYSSGMPAEENYTWRKKIAYLSRLPHLIKDFYQTQKRKND